MTTTNTHENNTLFPRYLFFREICSFVFYTSTFCFQPFLAMIVLPHPTKQNNYEELLGYMIPIVTGEICYISKLSKTKNTININTYIIHSYICLCKSYYDSLLKKKN